MGSTPLEDGVASVWVHAPRGQGCSSSREEPSGEAGVEEDGERLFWGSPGWGWGLGWTLLGKSERSAQFWGGDPFGDFGIHGGPWREVTELGAPLTLNKAMLFPRRASDGVPGGPLTLKGSLFTHTVAGDPAGPAQLPLQRCTRFPQTWAQLAPRRRRGSRRSRDGEWEDEERAAVPIPCPPRGSPPLGTRLRFLLCLRLCLRLCVPVLLAAGSARGLGVGCRAVVVA